MRALRETRVRIDIAAAPMDVYRCLLDPTAVAVWKVPDDMICQIHCFEPREGGRYRISLTHAAPDAVGKTDARTDTYHGEFVRLVPGEEVVERMAFETSDPSLTGWMTAVYALRPSATGTELLAIHGDVPPGVPLQDNEAGWKLALAKLAALAESPG